MRDFIIISDSCCDLEAGMREAMNIKYIPMNIRYAGKESRVDLDWSEYSPKEFYNMLRDGVEFKTSQVTIEMFIEHFREYLKKGFDILYISTSSGLSGSYNASLIAKNMLADEFPGAKILCVDSLRGSLGQGLILYYAAVQRDLGKTVEETAKYVEEHRMYIHQVGSVDDLKYLKRAGRVTGMAALMGGIFKIKPIIISNTKGENESVLKVKGRKTSIKTCLEFVKNHIINPSDQTVFIVHADCLHEALEMKEYLVEEAKVKDVYINYVGPVIGSTVGPGMFGIYFCGDKVTEDTAKNFSLAATTDSRDSAAGEAAMTIDE